MTVAESALRLQFFDLVFANDDGYLCIASRNPQRPQGDFQQKFFKYPEKMQDADDYILKMADHRDVYYCVNLLNKPERTKGNCRNTNLVWADLDSVDPRGLDLAPQIIIESSPGRFQALWKLSMMVDPFTAEGYSKRIAYAFEADKSGWDLTQLLRVPFTRNHKYPNLPKVNLISAIVDKTLPPLLFEAIPALETENPTGVESSSLQLVQPALPNKDDLPALDSILYKFKQTSVRALMTQEPGEGDWSTLLWKLIHTCIEAGMVDEEVFVVARASKCDKYDRDNRPLTDLWRDIQKARTHNDKLSEVLLTFKPLSMPTLVSEPATDTFINEYRAWGEEATDAIAEFHDLCAFILLSAVIANSVRLETSYGVMIPNLWGLLLGDSTLTRKTTSMRMVMDILTLVDNEMIIATDGSAEGLLTGIEQRPNKTSVFFKDEVSGFFDSMNRKDYLAGMTETLTALYDVPNIYTRRLRKETIRIESPAFIFFGGGVKNKVYETITENYVLSGFLPRFLVVTGETDMSRLRRTGPNTETGIHKRAGIVSKIADLYEHYAVETPMKIGGQFITMPPRIVANLTDDAWKLCGSFEKKMVDAGVDSAHPELAFPTLERLSRSMLKMAMCLAAIRQIPQNEKITVDIDDIVNAAWYVQKWGWYSIELIGNAGKGVTEKMLERVLKGIERNPGVKRSELMQHHHLDKRNADLILGTLEERMLVRKEPSGRGVKYWLAG